MKPLTPPQERVLKFAVSWLLGGLFLWACSLKILDPKEFATSVANYRLVPYPLINLVAITVPWVEVVAGLFLVLQRWVRASALVMTGMTAAFFVFIVSALARGLNIECGCFGTVGGHNIGLSNLVIDSAMLAMALWLSGGTRHAR